MIDKLNDQTKSDLLMSCMEWISGEVGDDAIGGMAYATKSDGAGPMLWSAPFVVDSPLADCPRLDLYEVDEKGDPFHMALAWRVLNWASEDKSPHPEEDDPIRWKLHEWLTFNVGWLDIQPPADAQRLWLDKILELTIEAGLIEVSDA